MRELRQTLAQAAAAASRPRQSYPLTGLVQCTACGHHMVGEVIGDYRTYACGSKSGAVQGRCTRHIAAQSLEAFVEEAAIRILEAIGPGGLAVAPVAVPGFAALPGDGPSDRATQLAIAVRPVDALDGVVTGPMARFAWRRLSLERKAAALSVLFRVIRIGPSSTARSVFDPTRIDAVPHPFHGAAEQR
ncbi:hypothetical protein GCM10009665_06760 [Kitasatospora nipponensis]|uniref:Recombinase zinc beta ribbon domain-containing protein n=1 Tax=Kitasatospora nipponensis TaxID=258049 RepID=A0ABN1VQ19_9ACTN